MKSGLNNTLNQFFPTNPFLWVNGSPTRLRDIR
jgi:hypothetical protein